MVLYVPRPPGAGDGKGAGPMGTGAFMQNLEDAIGVLMFVIGLIILGIVNKAFRMDVSDY